MPTVPYCPRNQYSKKQGLVLTLIKNQEGQIGKKIILHKNKIKIKLTVLQGMTHRPKLTNTLAVNTKLYSNNNKFKVCKFGRKGNVGGKYYNLNGVNFVSG